MSETLARQKPEQLLTECEALWYTANTNWHDIKRQRPENRPEQKLRIDFSPILTDADDRDRAFAMQYLG